MYKPKTYVTYSICNYKNEKKMTYKPQYQKLEVINRL